MVINKKKLKADNILQTSSVLDFFQGLNMCF